MRCKVYNKKLAAKRYYFNVISSKKQIQALSKCLNPSRDGYLIVSNFFNLAF